MGGKKIFMLSASVVCISYFIYNIFDSAPIDQTDGWVEKGFEEVKEAYQKIFANGLDKGSSFAVHYRGRLVVHLWGGCKTLTCSDIWRTDTTASMFSSTSFLGGICMAILVDRKLLNYSQPVSLYWPEFSMNGKGLITVEELLSYQGGVAGIDPPLTFEDIDSGGPSLDHRLAEQKPLWQPGSEAHFHPVTLGLYVDELFKHIDPMGRSCANFLEMEVINPLKLDIKIGLRDSNQEKRYAHPYSFSNIRLVLRPFLTTLDSAPRRILSAFFWNRNDTYKKIMSAVGDAIYGYSFHASYYRRLQLLSSNGISTVDSLARLMGLIAKNDSRSEFPQRMFGVDTLRQMMRPMTDLSWMSSINDLSFGRGAALINSPAKTVMIGYPGTGGQMAFADPAMEVGFAYLTNHLSPYSMGDDPRHLELQKALYNVINRLRNNAGSS